MSDYWRWGVFHHGNITIRSSAVISISDVVYEDDVVHEDLLNNDVEPSEKRGMFTVTLTNGYPITFRGVFGEIENEHKEFIKKFLRSEAEYDHN
jgi:hypothetical protein